MEILSINKNYKKGPNIKTEDPTLPTHKLNFKDILERIKFLFKSSILNVENLNSFNLILSSLPNHEENTFGLPEILDKFLLKLNNLNLEGKLNESLILDVIYNINQILINTQPYSPPSNKTEGVVTLKNKF